MDSLKVEPGSCSETCVMSSCVENQVIGIKVEGISNVEEEEEDPLLIPFTPIKSEYEVSVICVIHKREKNIYVYPGLHSILPHLCILSQWCIDCGSSYCKSWDDCIFLDIYCGI
jgi:hypothetical protein